MKKFLILTVMFCLTVSTLTSCAALIKRTTKNALESVSEALSALPTTGETDDSISFPDIDISDLHALDVKSRAKVIYTSGPKAQIVIHAEVEALRMLDLSYENGVLTIRNKPEYDDNHEKFCVFYITAPKLSHVTVSGVLDFSAPARMEMPSMKWDVEGVLTLHMKEAEIDQMKMEISGVSTYDLNLVKNESFELSIDGVANGNITLKGKDCTATVEGVANVNLNVDCQTLNVVNEGVGSLTLKGLADNVNLSGSGLTSINVKDLNK